MFCVADVVISGKDSALTPLQLRAAFRHIGYAKTPADDEVLSADHCLKLWIFMLIDRMKHLHQDERNLLAEEIVASTHGLADKIISGEAKTPMVVIADSRYATWHDRTGWLDLHTGDTVAAPAWAALETAAYNLAVLFYRNQNVCEKIASKKAQQHASTSNTGQ